MKTWNKKYFDFATFNISKVSLLANFAVVVVGLVMISIMVVPALPDDSPYRVLLGGSKSAGAQSVPPHAGMLYPAYYERLPDYCYMKPTYLFYGETCGGGEGGCWLDPTSEVWHWQGDCSYFNSCQEGSCTSGYYCLDGGSNEGTPTSIYYYDGRFKGTSERQVCEERYQYHDYRCENGYYRSEYYHNLGGDENVLWFQCNSNV